MHFKDIKDRLLEKGMSYEEYVVATIDEIEHTNSSELSEEKLKRFNFKSLNLKRSSRIAGTYEINAELKNILKQVTEPQLWMIITENWCGDSAQNLPYIVAFTRENSLISLKILLRDSNPDIMNQYLTNGTRSIPKLVAFNKDGEELFRWGPRPEAAVKLINQWKEEGLQKQEWMEKLHLWYSRNKGSELEKEFVELIKKEVPAH
jgi:hypothetical protein